jgi:hypothetical protein
MAAVAMETTKRFEPNLAEMFIGWSYTRFVFFQSEHIMGPGSHVGFPISAKNKNLVYDHTMNISAKFDSVHNVFSLAEILKIFLSETTKSIEL